MIFEHALINIQPDSHAEFEAAITKAREVMAAAPGFRSFALHRGIEFPDRYLLLVGWESLEAHTEGFRESPAFAEWRSHISPFFASPPEVDHYDLIPGLS
jgi:heme-degrading monooxygenase HmoA